MMKLPLVHFLEFIKKTKFGESHKYEVKQ